MNDLWDEWGDVILSQLHLYFDVRDITVVSTVCSHWLAMFDCDEMWKILYRRRFYYHDHVEENIPWKIRYKICYFSDIGVPLPVKKRLLFWRNHTSYSFECDFRPLEYSVILLGMVYCGKTAIYNYLMNRPFVDKYLSTLGSVEATTDRFVYGKKLALTVIDTSGQDRYLSFLRRILEKRDLGIIVYDMASRESVRSVELWVQELRNNKMKLALLGTKLDSEIMVVPEEMISYAEKNGLIYLGNISIKDEINCDIFDQRLNDIIADHFQDELL